MAVKKQNINLENIPDNAKVCPKPIQAPGLNTSNGDRAIQETNYGPAEGKSACGNCALFDASSRIRGCTGQSAKVGYCWANHFECESKNVCDAYEEGGPITDDGESYVLQMVNEDAALSDQPYEGGEVNKPQQEVIQQPVQQEPVEMMPPQAMMPPQQPMMPPQGQPPMQPPMMAYGGHLPKAQMGDWFSNKISQAKNYATDKYNQAKDAYQNFDYTDTDLYKKGQKALDYGQDALSVAGMIPGVGAAFDTANAAISGARVAGSAALGDQEALDKNKTDLAWNTAAIVPGAGQAATAGKFAQRAAKALDKGVDAVNVRNQATGVFNTAENIANEATGAEGSFASVNTPAPVVDEPISTDTEEPLVTRYGYELRKANKGLDDFYGYASPTKGSPYAGSPLANLLTFPHWSATMNLGSGSSSKEEYKPVQKIGDKNVYYNEETGEYESELDHRDRVGKEYYEKLNEENPDHFGQVDAYDSNSETIIYTSDDEKNKVGSTALRNNPEADAISWNVDDDGNFTFSAANLNPETNQYELSTPNTWTAQYASTVEKLQQFMPEGETYNPEDYRFVSKSGSYAYPNQGEQFQTYWNNYYMNNPYRAYEQMAEGGELPKAQRGMSYHNRGKTHGTRSQYGYNPYSIPAGGEWETVQHGTNQSKWEETEGWKEDSAGNEFWTISRDDARKWLRGRGHLTKDLTDQQKSTWAFHMYHGTPVKFKKWTNPNTKKDMVIIELRGDKLYVPADSALGQFNADQFNEYKRNYEGAYTQATNPFYDMKQRKDKDGNRIKRTDEEKQLEYDWRNTPYQQEYRIGKDGYTWGGWKYNGADRDMTYTFRDIDLRTLPYKLQQKYRVYSNSKLRKDAKTGKIYVDTEGQGIYTIQHDDLKWFNNPGRLGEYSQDPAKKKGNIFEYLNNPDHQPDQRYEDIDLEKIAKKDHNKFMWDVKQEAKKIEEEEEEKSKEYFKNNPWRLKTIEEEPEEEEEISIFKPKEDTQQTTNFNTNSNTGPFIPNMPEIILTPEMQEERKNLTELWNPITEAMGASTGTKEVSSKITNSAANAITQAYQTGNLNGQNYGEKDLQRDLNMYGEAYGPENLEKLKNHLQLPSSKYGSELAKYTYGSEFTDRQTVHQNLEGLHHLSSMGRRGKELPKAQVNIRNEADYSRYWKPDWKDDLTFSNTISPDYTTGLGVNLDVGNSILNANNEYEMDTSNAMSVYQQNKYNEENPHLEGVMTMNEMQGKIDAGNQVQEELDASGTPTPNPQAQFTEFMDQSEAMKNKNDFSQLTDEEREALKKHQEENTPEEEGAGALDVFSAVSSDIVGLAQGVFNPMFEARDARKRMEEEKTKTADDLYSPTATTQGVDPYQTGMDTIYQDADYGTNVKFGKELMEEDAIEIDEELYRKLIAAGADIEIL